jgi:hypothetical protein
MTISALERQQREPADASRRIARYLVVPPNGTRSCEISIPGRFRSAPFTAIYCRHSYRR